MLRRSAPRSSKCVAKLWRRLCGLILALAAVCSTYLRTMFWMLRTDRRVPEGFFTRLAFGAEGATVTGNTVCDSYDSAKGTYASQASGDHAGENGDVGSNGDIRVSGVVKVYGDATPGPGCTVTGSGYVHGSTAPAEEEAEVAVYSYAPEGESPGELDTERTLAGGTYRFSSIKLASNDTLYLGVFPGEEVTVYVDEHIRITANARIVILDGVKVVIHHGGTPGAGIVFAGRGVVNESGTPARLLICSATAGNLVFAGSSDFHGAVLAPLARVRLTGTSAFYGAVVARETDITCARAHYDEALAYPETGGLTPYGSVSWRVLK